jgi:hypothetical protein
MEEHLAMLHSALAAFSTFTPHHIPSNMHHPCHSTPTFTALPLALCCYPPPQVVLGLGVAAASLYGLHQLLAPRITAWSQQLSASRREAQEAEAARTAALTAALQSLSEGQAKLLESVQGLSATLQQQQQQRPGSSQAMRGIGSSAAYGAHGEAQSSISFHQHRGANDEHARCQSPSAAAASGGGSSQRQQQQYSSNARGWDPYADPSRGAAIRSAGYSSPGYSGPGYSSYGQPQQQQHEGVASSVGGVAAGAGQGFEVVPRSSQAASEAMWGASSSNGPVPAGTAAGVAQQDISSSCIACLRSCVGWMRNAAAVALGL